MILYTVRHKKKTNEFDLVLDCPPCWNTQSLKIKDMDADFLNNTLPLIRCMKCGVRENDDPTKELGSYNCTIHIHDGASKGYKYLFPKDLKRMFNYIWKPL